MKFRMISIILLTMLLISAASISHAQYESDNRSRVGVRMFGYMPSDSHLKDMDSVWLTPCIDVNLMYDAQDRPTGILSFGWFGADNNYHKANLMPITASYVKYFNDNPDNSSYLSCGLGIYNTKFEGYENYSWNSYSGTNFGMNIAGGITFGSGWFAELRYDKSPNLSAGGFGDIDFSGLSICVGSHMGF